MATIDPVLERYLALSRPADKAQRTPIVHRSGLFGENTTVFSHFPVEVSCAFSTTLSASFEEHKALAAPTQPIPTEIVGGDFLSIKRLLLWALCDHLANKNLSSGVKTVPDAYLYSACSTYTPTTNLYMMLETIYRLDALAPHRVAIVSRQHELPEGFIGAADYLAVVRTFPPDHHARRSAVFEIAHLVSMRKLLDTEEGLALWRIVRAEKPQRLMMEINSQLVDMKTQMGFRTSADDRREKAERKVEERDIAAGIALSLAEENKTLKRKSSGGLFDERELKKPM